jgi:hypothetical protein
MMKLSGSESSEEHLRGLETRPYGPLWVDLLIERYQEPAPCATDRLTVRLDPTHRIRIIELSERSPQDYPELQGLPNHTQALGVREYRPDSQQWLYAKAR